MSGRELQMEDWNQFRVEMTLGAFWEEWIVIKWLLIKVTLLNELGKGER